MLLEVIDLRCERDERVLFRNLNFSVDAGRILQIAGQNGSGKTTLLRILCGLSQDYQGAIHWRGRPIDDLRQDYYSSLLYFGHHTGLKAVLTPLENLRWQCALFPSLQLYKLYQALAKVGLAGYEDVPCHMLSAGQLRRVSLARLYMTEARLWIMDEPFTSLDRQGVTEKEALLERHVANGGAIILTTHYDLGIKQPVAKIDLDSLRRQH
jgi:heme exporter protein A